MKLYEVSNQTWVSVRDDNPTVPPAAKELKYGSCMFFDHIDGMYSYCKDVDGDLVHLSASAEVEIITKHKHLRQLISWGGRGKDQTNEVATFRKIKDISDSHLDALVKYFKGKPIRPDIVSTVIEEVAYRVAKGIKVEDYED